MNAKTVAEIFPEVEFQDYFKNANEVSKTYEVVIGESILNAGEGQNALEAMTESMPEWLQEILAQYAF